MPHLFELEDLPGFPQRLRRQQVEFIGWLVDRFALYAPVVPLLAQALAAQEEEHLTDLGSGSGGPVHFLARQKALSHVRFLLTDRFPHPRPLPTEQVVWHPLPVDALAADAPGTGMIGMFNVFHHFTAVEQERLVRLHGRRGLFICEVLQPGLPTFLKILFTTTVGQLLLAPFVRPFRWERLLFTYLLPINLLTVTWDGLVSVCRVDAADTLVHRVRAAAPPETTVHGGTVGSWWARITWVHCQAPRRT